MINSFIVAALFLTTPAFAASAGFNPVPPAIVAAISA
ncbi:hypothetical protein M2321_002617 [Rhodoblastus acidophilus]|jgi:hypothetical protein|nr:hypothetical protein [Rhodoblastus acidophilus]